MFMRSGNQIGLLIPSLVLIILNHEDLLGTILKYTHGMNDKPAFAVGKVHTTDLGRHNEDRKGTKGNGFSLCLNFDASSCQHNGGLTDPLIQIRVTSSYICQ